MARQYALEGRAGTNPTLLGLLLRLPHHRFLPILLCRLSRATRQKRLPLIPGLLTYLNIVLFGLEVSSRCEIGPGIFFPHTVGTVVGAWRLGANVTIYQGVTLGAKELNMSFDPGQRPDVGNDVVLGSGCKVLGPVRIGDNVVVGANSVVLSSVESGSTVVGIPAKPMPARRVTACL